MKFLLILIWLAPTLVIGQISNRLLQQLPDTLRPINRSAITYQESLKIIKAARLLALPSNQDYLEIDRLCGKIGPFYKSFASKEQSLEHVEFVIRYWLNGITKSNSADSARKYIEIYGKLIDRDLQKYHTEHANYLFFKGMVLIEDRLYPQAYSSLIKSIQIYKEEKNYRFVVYTFGLLNYMYRELALYQMGINSSDSSLFYIKVWNKESKIDPKLLQLVKSTMLSGKIRTYCSLLEETGKKSYADSAIKTAHIIKASVHKNLRAEAYEVIARILYHQKNYAGCIGYADSSLLNCCNNYSSVYATNVQIYKGLSLIKLGKKSEGIDLIKHNPIKGSGPEAARIAKELYNYEKGAGNLANALFYHEKLQALQNYSTFLKNLGQIVDIQQNYEIVANSLNIQKQKELERQNRAIVVAILVSICFGGLLIGIRYRTNKNKNRHLLSQIEELTELQILRIEDEKEKERRRLGQELHDELSGTIAASVRYLRMKAEDEFEGRNKAWITEISDVLEKGYDKARGKSHELFSEETSENFWKRLTDSIDLFFAGTDMQITFIRDTSGVTLKPEIKTTLLVIIKEAMTNVVKHSNASEVEILIYEDLNRLILEVGDNGNGMSINSVTKKKVGLLSIKERLNTLNGEITISVRKPSGTSIKFSIPLK